MLKIILTIMVLIEFSILCNNFVEGMVVKIGIPSNNVAILLV